MRLGDILDFGAQKWPDRIALATTATRRTYAELNGRVHRLSAGLAARLPEGSTVAVLSENRAEYVELYFGVPMGGMALAHINYRLHTREMAWIIENAASAMLIVEGKYLDALLPQIEHLPGLKIVTFSAHPEAATTYEQLLIEDLGHQDVARTVDDDLAWLIYTSGTTGRPKGARLTHRNIVTSVLSWMSVAQPERARTCLMCFPLCHVAGYVVPRYFLEGSTLLLQPTFQPEAFMDGIDSWGVETTSMAPTMLAMLLAHPMVNDYDLSSLRTIGYGGSSITPDLLRRAMQRFPDAGFTQGCGMTELAGNALMMDEASHLKAAREQPDLLAAAGRPMPLAAVRILGDGKEDVPVGTVGEIVVRGDQVFDGYWRNEDATSDSFVDGWFQTGDLGKFDQEGYVYLVDRRKDMIVSGGENVYSVEVESAIDEHPLVAEVAVIGVPSDEWGERVCAIVVPSEAATLDGSDVISYCRERLAGYKCPRIVHLSEELPKGASGKILKRVLKERYAASGSALGAARGRT